MTIFSGIFFFVFGTVIGSFLNVLIFRYDPNRSLVNIKTISGRSHCPKCRKVLSVFELIPVVSFLFLRGKCRACRERISFQYPLIEALSGAVFVFVPLFLNAFYAQSNSLFFSFNLAPWYYFLVFFWVLVFLSFIVLAAIDLRFFIIPDEINVFIAILGAFIAWLTAQNAIFLPPYSLSFVRHYALVFSPTQDIFLSHALGAGVATIFFLGLVLITRGKGMGMGDVKFMAAAGILFGWPDIGLGILFAFILGGIWSAGLFFRRKKGMKDKIPFGPFLVLGLSLVFFFGFSAVTNYFGLFNI